MPNPFVHMELMSTDPDKVKAFYGKLFDWKLEDMKAGADAGTYTVIRVDEGTGGGIMKNPIPNSPSIWMPYISVDNLRTETAKAQSLGATLMKDVTEVPNMGSFTILTDPAGGMFGLWQSM